MDPALRAFAELLQAPDAEVDLALAALDVARIEHPRLVPERELPRLDDLARRSGARELPTERLRLDRLRCFLFEEEGFRGNADDYYDPKNSCLNDVLDRKLGIPITLSVLMMEVGRRVGLRIAGAGIPGHFMVVAEVGTVPQLLDPFNGGVVVTSEEAGEVASRAVGRPLRLTESHLQPVSKREVVERMLRNLKRVYVQREAWEKALAVIDRLLLLAAPAPVHLRDRGTVLMKLGEFHRGAAEWERYLTRYPHATDADRLRGQLKRVREALASLN
ncbi:MAG: tetratricopeptide repeat protein [Candidatus Rokubacteria bacterium]|nr:tetratricopeptide repeat protein [Candidatus Rokubacteria bacterium]